MNPSNNSNLEMRNSQIVMNYFRTIKGFLPISGHEKDMLIELQEIVHDKLTSKNISLRDIGDSRLGCFFSTVSKKHNQSRNTQSIYTFNENNYRYKTSPELKNI